MEDITTIEKDAVQIYQNASALVIQPDEEKKLDEPIDEMNIEIRPDGLIYPPQVFWRDKLNQTFGRGQWALIKHKSAKDPERDKVYYDGSLIVRNCFVARASGEAEYHISNPMQSWASVEEAAKSDCLGRCCKDLGIFKELWQPNFVRNWIKKYGVKVFIEVEKNGAKKTSVSWRRIDSEPYWNEKGFVPDSPNKPANKKQQPEVKQKEHKEVPLKGEIRPEIKAKIEKDLGGEDFQDIIEKTKSLDELRTAWVNLPKSLQPRYDDVKNAMKLVFDFNKEVSRSNDDKAKSILDSIIQLASLSDKKIQELNNRLQLTELFEVKK